MTVAVSAPLTLWISWLYVGGVLGLSGAPAGWTIFAISASLTTVLALALRFARRSAQGYNQELRFLKSRVEHPTGKLPEHV